MHGGRCPQLERLRASAHLQHADNIPASAYFITMLCLAWCLISHVMLLLQVSGQAAAASCWAAFNQSCRCATATAAAATRAPPLSATRPSRGCPGCQAAVPFACMCWPLASTDLGAGLCQSVCSTAAKHTAIIPHVMLALLSNHTAERNMLQHPLSCTCHM